MYMRRIFSYPFVCIVRSTQATIGHGRFRGDGLKARTQSIMILPRCFTSYTVKCGSKRTAEVVDLIDVVGDEVR